MFRAPSGGQIGLCGLSPRERIYATSSSSSSAHRRREHGAVAGHDVVDLLRAALAGARALRGRSRRRRRRSASGISPARGSRPRRARAPTGSRSPSRRRCGRRRDAARARASPISQAAGDRQRLHGAERERTRALDQQLFVEVAQLALGLRRAAACSRAAVLSRAARARAPGKARRPSRWSQSPCVASSPLGAGKRACSISAGSVSSSSGRTGESIRNALPAGRHAPAPPAARHAQRAPGLRAAAARPRTITQLSCRTALVTTSTSR